ncbi:hypothetical protein GGX14DRAFT_376445 [Mycena pura]|uniref:Tetraspanin Tsp2 n=1 Tax=Mycena pura TaxID=153505 RepID=A0AAD6Y8E4_9AGAR|nr:hypothetical protein GGX14DRAFT_376445 [Mycena pura]
MPDFTRLSHLARGLSAHTSRLRFSRTQSTAPNSSHAVVTHRPHTPRSQSDGSSTAGTASSGTTAVDEGHRALIKSIGTTDRFTHKWPRPQSLRVDSAADVVSARLLENGLGVDSAESWTAFKWCLLFSVCTVFTYGGAALICALMTWFRTWNQADVMYVADNDVLVLITLAGAILVFTALVGLSGVLLNARPILAMYTILLWPAFAALVAIGYVAYKRAAYALDHKLNLSWSQYYTPLGRLLIQDSLHCCGFYSALHEATSSKRCYFRTALPGCKGKLYRFERANLALIWSTVFSLVPMHLLNILLALLCANHVTETFGRGLTPERYRLTGSDVQADAAKLVQGAMPSEVMPKERLQTVDDFSREWDGMEHESPFLWHEEHQHQYDGHPIV